MTTGAEDGHERSGTFVFSVGAASAPAPMPTPMLDDDRDHGESAIPASGTDHGAMDHEAMDHDAMVTSMGPVLTGLIVVPLVQQNASGVDGRAEILPVEGGMKSQVGVYLNGIEPGSTQLAMVHMQGLCGGPVGPHESSLDGVTSVGVPHGRSVTVIDVPFSMLADGKHAIIIHASDKSVIACGVIPNQPRASITLPSAGSAGAGRGGALPPSGVLLALGFASIAAGAGMLHGKGRESQ
ncbi:MAG: hypothetical protein HY873_02585 [Chloroflexi bacterium]|nr:hypothetical protein [Chloroflexota bacterium]